MRRLSGEAAGFLCLELPTQPMNNVVLAVLRPPSVSSAPLDRAYLHRHVALRLGEVPALRWRVAAVPCGLHHHVVFEDPDFDLDDHLREVALPSPGGPEQLDRLCAALAGTTLDRRHPLWQLTLVNGLDGGGQAVILRVHHCLMDGFATVTALSYLFSGEDHDVVTPAEPWAPERVPRRARLVLDAVRDQGRAARRWPALARRTKRGWSALKAQTAAATRAEFAVLKPGAGAPACSINQAFTAERRFARTSLPLADLKAVKAVAGASVNDVVLAVVGGAFRAYLLARGDLPDQPLVATVPVGLEAPGAPPRTHGNRFSGLVTSLATDVGDPWERLGTIQAVTAESKRRLAIFGSEMLPDWLDYLPPAILTPIVHRGHRQRQRHPGKVGANLGVSNVRGPAVPCRLGRAWVDELFVAGPPDARVGANVVLWDYGDRVLVSVLSFADSVNDPAEVVAGMHVALAELVAAAASRVGGAS